jgi:hypothetical protein
MKTRLLLIASAVVALTSCSTYRSGQTPDDVYYSPGRQAAYAETQQRMQDQPQDEYVDMSDRYLRMKAMNRSRWSTFDNDYMYWNNPTWNNAYMYNSLYTPGYQSYSAFSPYYGYGSGFGMGGWYGGMGFGYSNFWGSPFYPGYYGAPIVVVGKPVYHNPAAYGPRTYNLNTYTNPGRPVNGGYSHLSNPTSVGNDRNGNATYNAPVRVFSNTGATGGNLGGSRYSGSYRGTDGGSSDYSAPRGGSFNSGSSSPARSFNSGSSSGGATHSSGGSGGGSAPTRSFSSSPRGKG